MVCLRSCLVGLVVTAGTLYFGISGFPLFSGRFTLSEEKNILKVSVSQHGGKTSSHEAGAFTGLSRFSHIIWPDVQSRPKRRS